MRIRYAIFLLALFCLTAGIGRAQSVPTLEVALNYAHVGVTPTSPEIGNFNMNGANGQISYNFNKWISGVGDVTYATMRPTASTGLIGLTIKGTEISYLLGPRLSYRHLGRFVPYAQIMVGMFHDTETTLDDPFKSQFKLGYSAGGGIDVKVKSYLAIRPIALDVQRTQFAEQGSTREVQTNLRISAGVVLLF